MRAEMLARREAAASSTLGVGEAVQAALMADPIWKSARLVALYMAFKGEVGTDLLLRDAWARGRRVLLPRCGEQKGFMELVPCSGLEDLQPGRYGMLEPRSDVPAWAWDDPALTPDFMVVPGVAFDRKGRRLGFGGGYYDRALARPAMAGCRLTGLAFSWQVVDELPWEAWDRPVHGLCTEEGCTWL